MNFNTEDRWARIELILLRSYLLLHTGSGLVELIVRQLGDVGHKLSLW
jgi:hypothetical protein